MGQKSRQVCLLLHKKSCPRPEVKTGGQGCAAPLADPFNKNNKHLLYRQLESFVIESDRPLHMNLDGEPVVEKRFEFKTHPCALSVVLGSAR